jgi:hypothetical protein
MIVDIFARQGPALNDGNVCARVRSDEGFVPAIARNVLFVAGYRGLQLHDPEHSLLSQLSTSHLISALRGCHFGPPQD